VHLVPLRSHHRFAPWALVRLSCSPRGAAGLRAAGVTEFGVSDLGYIVPRAQLRASVVALRVGRPCLMCVAGFCEDGAEGVTLSGFDVEDLGGHRAQPWADDLAALAEIFGLRTKALRTLGQFERFAGSLGQILSHLGPARRPAPVCPRHLVESVEVLGLTWPTTREAVVHAHRARMFACHPDRVGDQYEATRAATRINRARDTLLREALP
jgi:hypothetical protein